MAADPRIEIVQADITTLSVDCIVNAANASLLGGGGVDGAIHRAAGPQLREECHRLGGCLPGEAKVTAGFRLPARWIIHTVGPVWSGIPQDDEALAACYHHSLELAADLGASSIAFPAISTGAYRFPADRAASIAVATIMAFLKTDQQLKRVVLCCFDRRSQNMHHIAVATATPSYP